MHAPSRSAFLLLCTVTGMALNARAGPQSHLVNGDFESGNAGEAPAGWFAPVSGYTAELTGGASQGELCARLYRSSPTGDAPFGNLMQQVKADAFRGKIVRFRASVRVAGDRPEDRAQLWLRVDLPNGRVGFFDNMDDRPIRSSDWREFEIVGPVAKDATAISLGLILISSGSVWLDDASLEAPGGRLALEPPRPLEGRGLDNLVALARLIGYVRFFHPSDEAAAADWAALALEGVPAVEAASTPEGLASRLIAFAAPLAPTLRIGTSSEPSPLPDKLRRPSADDARVVRWRHVGVGLGPGGTSQSIYSSRRDYAILVDGVPPPHFVRPDQALRLELGAGVWATLPVSLYVDERGTLPRAAPANPSSRPASVASGEDRTTRLADVALAWSVFQHFYPYFDVVECDWDQALRDALKKAATDADECAFRETLAEMVAQLRDGHGNVYHGCVPEAAALPLAWDWIEGQLVITAVAPQARGADGQELHLKPGDVVRAVDDRPVGEILDELERRTSGATPQWRRHSALTWLASRGSGPRVALEVVRDGEAPRRVVVSRAVSEAGEPIEPRPQPIAEVAPGIWYVDLDRVSDDEFLASLPKLEEASGLVFDLRGYPRRLSTVVLAHLTDQPVTCAQWHVPRVTLPDRRDMQFDRSHWTVPPRRPRLTAKAAFIIDGRAISYAETYLGIVEHYRLAALVGQPTAGTNGNINPFSLPGGYQVVWTGMKVLKQDGSQHHGVGIRPTVPVERTLRGVREGRDELLERAIEVVGPARR
jgi:C-terminal processing protease CtpA/Prc